MSGAGSKRLVAILLAAFLVAFFAIYAIAQGLSDPEVPSGDVAVVEDAPGGPITQEEFDLALEQAAASQGAQGGVPEEGDPQYDALKEQALGDLILARWVAGEAADEGITVTDTELEQRLDQIKQQNFADEKEYQRFLDQSGFSEEDALERVRVSLLSERLQESVLSAQQEPPEGAVEAFYEENASQFEQPESRDVRVILNKDEAEAEEASEALAEDDSDRSWEQVAKRFSTDEASRNDGGLRSAVVEGQSDAAFDEQVFGAAEGELVGPFETGEGFYLIQVTDIKEATTTPLEEASEQIAQQITSAQQQATAEEFEADFVSKWTARTFCAPDFVIERCANAPLPPRAEGQPPIVSSRPAAPGSAGSLTPGLSTGGLAQGPYPPPVEQPAGVPPGAAPIGPPGAPPTGAPPGAAPPAGAPPTG
ncbi:MAG: peptidyl-prolyl cis-trans isomerase, partial [Solirubrobacterales bacterium]